MSLLPIIYASLLIFTALLSIVLIVSYISYKAKRRTSAPDNSIHEEIERQRAAAALVISHPAYTPAPQALTVPAYPQQVKTVYTTERRNTGVVYAEKERDNQRNTRTRETATRNRFHVVNNVSRNEFLNKLQPSALGGFSRTPAPELNFLNYYSDRKEDNLSSILVDRYSNFR